MFIRTSPVSTFQIRVERSNDRLQVDPIRLLRSPKICASPPQDLNIITFLIRLKGPNTLNRASHVLSLLARLGDDHLNSVSRPISSTNPFLPLTHFLHGLDRLAKRCRVHTLSKVQLQDQG